MTTEHYIGDNVVVKEDENGEAVIEHTQSDNSVTVGSDGVDTEALHTEETQIGPYRRVYNEQEDRLELIKVEE